MKNKSTYTHFGRWIKLNATTFIAFLLLACSAKMNAQKLNLEWAKNMGGPEGDIGRAIALDSKGNVYITGYYIDSADFNPGAGTAMLRSVASGYNNIFLAKYDANGSYLWAIGIAVDEYGGQPRGITVDNNDNVYITGSIYGKADFDPGPSTAMLTPINDGYGDAFVAKYNSDGRYLWAISIGGSEDDQGERLVVDEKENVYVTGYFSNANADFDPGSGTANLTHAGETDAFMAKYDANGNYVWAKSISGPRVDQGTAIALDSLNNIYLAGYFGWQTTDFDPGSGVVNLTYNGGYNDMFIAKYDSNGNYVWAESIGGNDAETPMQIALDAAGDIYITGVFGSPTLDFDPGPDTAIFTLRATGSLSDAFVAKYDANGKYIWAGSIGGDQAGSFAQGSDLSFDDKGNLYVTGTFWAWGAGFDFNFGPDAAVITPDGPNAFVARYTTNGKYLWAGSTESAGTIAGNGAYGWGIAVNTSIGSAYVTGNFARTVDFDPGAGNFELIATDPSYTDDVFLMKLSCNDTSLSLINTSIECGANYTLNEEVYNTSGRYLLHFYNSSGCDSTIVLDLTVLPLEKPTVNIDTFTLGVSDSYASYQWIKNGTDIPGATDSTYTVSENADYQVRVTNAHGCEQVSDVYPVTNVSVENINGIGKFVHVYPNPAKDILYIQSPVNVNINLNAIDGRNVLYMENAKSIPLQDLNNGIYLLHIFDPNGKLIKVEKIIRDK